MFLVSVGTVGWTPVLAEEAPSLETNTNDKCLLYLGTKDSGAAGGVQGTFVLKFKNICDHPLKVMNVCSDYGMRRWGGKRFLDYLRI